MLLDGRARHGRAVSGIVAGRVSHTTPWMLWVSQAGVPLRSLAVETHKDRWLGVYLPNRFLILVLLPLAGAGKT